MEKVKCDYCGQEFDQEIMTTLDNGCPAYPNCAKEEEKKVKERNRNNG